MKNKITNNPYLLHELHPSTTLGGRDENTPHHPFHERSRGVLLTLLLLLAFLIPSFATEPPPLVAFPQTEAPYSIEPSFHTLLSDPEPETDLGLSDREEDEGAPVADSIGALLLLGLAYGLYIRKRERLKI